MGGGTSASGSVGEESVVGRSPEYPATQSRLGSTHDRGKAFPTLIDILEYTVDSDAQGYGVGSPSVLRGFCASSVPEGW